MADPRATIVLDGEAGPLRRKLREALTSVEEFGTGAERAFGGMASPLKAVTDKFMAFTAILAGGAFAGEAIKATVDFSREINSLSRVLGVSKTQATAWSVAVGDIYSTSEALVSAIGKLNRVISEDEDKINALGIATRSANGELRAQGDIFLSVTEYLNKFKEGTDRNIEGSRIFTKSWEEVAPLLKLTAASIEDARQKAESLGLTMTEESDARVSAYRAAMNDVGDVMLGIKNVIAQALMPVLTKLGQWFSNIGPGVVTVFKGAIGGLTAVFWGLENAVTIVWEVLMSMIYTVTEPLRSLVSGLYKAMTGDIQGAEEEMMNWPDRVGQVWSQSWKNMVASSEQSRDKLYELFAEGGTPTVAKPEGVQSEYKAKKTTSKTTEKSASQIPALETRLAEEQDFLNMAYSKQQQREYWLSVSAYAKLSAEDRAIINRRAAQLEVEIIKETAAKSQQIEANAVQASEQLEYAKLDAQRAAARYLVETEQITKQQQLGLEAQFETERYNIQAAALQQRMQLLAQDPTTNAVELARIKDQMLLIEQQYQNNRMQIAGKMAQESGLTSIFENAASSAGNQLDGLLTKTQTWGQAMASVYASVRQQFIKSMVTEPLAAWAAGQARQVAMMLGFSAQKTAIEGAGAAKTVGIKATEATAVTSANAVEAGTGGAAAMASIPYIGPILAIAAMAALFAAVMGMGRSVKSARGGFDIPKGINPMTQLHEEEMVLPKGPAGVIRQLAENGMGSSSGDSMVVNFHDNSGTLTEAEIERKATKIANALNKLHRNGWRPAR